jgi:hypothetical protein
MDDLMKMVVAALLFFVGAPLLLIGLVMVLGEVSFIGEDPHGEIGLGLLIAGLSGAGIAAAVGLLRTTGE